MRIKCFFCGKYTTNMIYHKQRCNKWKDLSRDVLVHNILPHVQHQNNVSKFENYTKYIRQFIINNGSSRYCYCDKHNCNTFSREKINKKTILTDKHIIFVSQNNDWAIIGFKNLLSRDPLISKRKINYVTKYYIKQQNYYDKDHRLNVVTVVNNKLIEILNKHNLSLIPNYNPYNHLNEWKYLKKVKEFNKMVKKIIKYHDLIYAS